MRIILCDDDTAFTQVFEKRLLTVFKKYGITPEIVSAHTGVEALREITRRPTDVLFLDIDMPEKDGFSVAEELSAMPSKPLIISCPAWKIWCISRLRFSRSGFSAKRIWRSCRSNRENAAASQQPSDSLHGYDERQQHPHSNHGDCVF